MKELSTEQKATRYDEALGRAKKLQETCDSTTVVGWSENIFPELKESEDERIRKSLIKAFGTIGKKNWGGLIVRDIVAWLEKQGEKPTDKVESKFKVGDWIVTDDSFGKIVRHVDEISSNIIDERYVVSDEYGLTYNISFDKEHKWHKWTIDDANDGDVLVDSYSKDSFIILYKGIDKERNILAHCGWNGYYLFVTSNDGLGCGGLDNTDYLPATKEQRDLLFAKMKEAGYEWNAEKKELRKIESKTFNE